MKKIIILIPIYNDWQSLEKLIFEINKNINEISNTIFKLLIVNDASTTNQPKLKKPQNIESINILNMKQNRGHARCNAFGIRYALKNENFDHLILMDGDGEDRPEEIKSLLNSIYVNPNTSVVAKRVKRSEGFFFQFLYSLHKILTQLFTGKKIHFGNYSCLTKNDAQLISDKGSLWSSYSGTIKNNLEKLNEIDSIRGKRFFGPSKMSLINLIIHSFSIIAVFKFQVFLRSLIILIVLLFMNKFLGNIIFAFQILILIFNVVIFIVSRRENKQELIDSEKNLEAINTIT
tara:strand:+ start:2520 stop:3389 length:870 start_codon:yes stop_codon:yes gene_type:complete